jgi:putative hydrolase of the HAD superfamily
MNSSRRMTSMKKAPAMTCLFLDIGGVLLTNGWDHHARRRAAARFKINWREMESRHELFDGPYELGLIQLEEYLNRVIFFKKRSFTKSRFRQFIFDQSKPYPEMMELITQLKKIHGLKIVVVSNEGREINAHRIQKFKLAGLADSFISSCFVQLQKPDARIYQLALDTAQVPAGRIVYIEDTPLFKKAGESLGIKSILHQNYRSTRAQLSALGLPANERISYE